MSRPLQKTKAPRPAKPKGPFLSPALVDQEPIRRKAHRDYEKKHRELARLEKKISEFESRDESAYRSFLHKELGSLITALREVEITLNEKLELLEQIEGLIQVRGYPPGKAYEQALHWRDHPEDVEPEPGDASEPKNPWEEDANPFEGLSEMEREAIKKIYESMKDAFEKTYGVPPRDFDEMEDDLKNPWGSQKSSQKAPDKNLRELYRSIVRLLHPDRAGEQSPFQKELWHKTQEAYQQGNRTALEVILARCEAGEAGVMAITRVSLVLEITRQVVGQIKQLNAKIRSLKRNPAWEFGLKSPSDLDRVRREAKHEFSTLLQHNKRELSQIETELKRYEAAHKKWKLAPDPKPVPPKKSKTSAKVKKSDPHQTHLHF